MHLKRLEIKGFKSFADYTEIHLDPGMNIIVGPNGCGKSNVVDAIRWVLGEPNIRQLRGQRNEDIIFNGSDEKRPLGMAMVEITIDNSNHVLPLDYNEVTLARKYYRSGESEFFINRSPVRLKDINQLFTGTGMGKQGYSIIGQGELETVLKGQPFDRRLMLEEASGVIKYRQQRDEVQLRIDRTAADLLRVKDILFELNNRREELQIKAHKARQYLELQETFQSLEKTLLASQGRQLRQQIYARETEIKDIARTIEQEQGQIAALSRQLHEEQEKREQLRKQLGELRDKKYSRERECQQLQSDCRLGEERIKNIQQRQQSGHKDLEKYRQMLEQINAELAGQDQELQEQEKDYRQIQLDQAQQQQELEQLQTALQQANSHLEQNKIEAFERVQAETDLHNQIIDQEKLIKQGVEKKERLSIRVDSNREEIRSQKEQLSQLQSSLHELGTAIEQVEVQLRAIRQEREALIHNQQTLEQQRSEKARELMNTENRLLTLQEMDKNYSGYSDGVKAIMKASEKQNLPGIHGVIGELIEVPGGMETAIDTAAGRALENIVVERADQAQEAIHYLKSSGAGRVTFLPLDILKIHKLSPALVERLSSYQGVLGVASRLVSFDARYEKAVEYLLGRILLVEDMDTALHVFRREKSGMRIVTLEGELLNASGAMTGGTQRKRRSTPLQRRAEAKQIKELIRRSKEELAVWGQELQELEQQMEEIDNKLEQQKQTLMKQTFQRDMIEQEINSLQKKLSRYSQELENDLWEMTNIDQHLQESESKKLELQQQYEEYQQRNQAFSEAMEGLRSRIQEDVHQIELLQERLTSLHDTRQRKARELEKRKENRQQFVKLQQSYQNSISEIQHSLQSLAAEMKKQVQSLEQDRFLFQTRQEEQMALVSIIEQREADEQESIRAIDSLSREIEPLQRSLSGREAAQHQQQMRLVRLESEMDNLTRRWAEKYADEAVEQWESDLSPAQLRQFRQQLEEIRRQMEELGSVDLDAIEEYSQVQERYDFLIQQSTDLEKARESLEELLQKTEKTMSTDFQQFLSLADESFQQTFREIFGGGEAQLSLQQEEDPFTAGVEIMVKMPGKKAQSLNLLSGGERALTCIAFIFALLRLRPAPFCLLDEIDAALDQTNLVRFAHFIKNMAESTQFIVITHRQATIEAGKKIYGVTMPQNGVSSVLSLTLPEVESIAG